MNETPERKEHHFLFHIFRMDKEENPMPQNRAEPLLRYLKKVFADKEKRRT